ncbi:MAG TPA: DUF998 domain-containing protein [Candidatus Limnocylindrales bacterium]|nr:DUF998 domain-containing protein [Candidatus Limnocylindrales bacterium]
MAAEVTTGAVALHTTTDGFAAGDRRLSGIALSAISSSFLLVTMLAASIAPGYDFHGAAISDLGVIAETATLFNLLLVAIGAMNIAAGYLLYRRQHRAVLVIYVLAGIGAIGAGMFPLSTGGLHGLFALMAFVGFNLEVIGSAMPLVGPMRVLGVAAGAVGLAYAAVMVAGDSGNAAVFGPIGHGGTERMIAYPAMLWLLAFGGYLMAPAAPARDRSRR